MGSEEVREVLGRKRTIEILRYLSENGLQNYSEIEAQLETSSDTISDSLSLLGEYRLVERQERSAKDVQYRITDQGQRLLDAVETIEELLSESNE